MSAGVKPRFISFEGGDGVGKTTQIAALEARLVQAGERVLRVREPGSTPGAERIRQLILNGEPGDWLAMSELMLMNAARHDLVERAIKPALAVGQWVLADRYADSSRAYQIAAGRLDPVAAEAVIQAATGGLEPGLTLLLEVQARRAFERIAKQQDGDAAKRESNERRFEAKGLDFQQRAQAGFASLAARFPHRVQTVDAGASADEIAERIWRAVVATFDLEPTA